MSWIFPFFLLSRDKRPIWCTHINEGWKLCAWTCTVNSYRKSHQFSNILYQQDLGAIFISICPGAAALASQYTSLNAQYCPLKVLQTPGLFTVNLQCSHVGASFTGKQEMQIFGSSTRGNCVCSKQWNMHIFKKNTSAPEVWAENFPEKSSMCSTNLSCKMWTPQPGYYSVCWNCSAVLTLLSHTSSTVREWIAKTSSLTLQNQFKKSSQESVWFSPIWSYSSWKRSNTGQHAVCMGGIEQIPGYFVSALPEYSVSQWIPALAK